MTRKLLAFAILLLSLSSCSHKTVTPVITQEDGDSVQDIPMQYSELLEMKDLGKGRTLCLIYDPWRTDRIVMQYLLIPETDTVLNKQTEETLYNEYGESIILRTPLKRMTIISACHAWLLSQLDALDNIAVMCDTNYVAADNVKQWMRGRKTDGTSQILSAGTSMSPNAEILMAGKSDAIWICPFENAGLGNVAQLPIPIIYCAEYMETSPLGRAEWMKFFGRLVDKAEVADSLFRAIDKRYNSLVGSQEHHHKLLAELPYGATWYVPGGRSTSAILYEDAGFHYPWREDTHSGSLSLSKEAVLAKAQDCDIWLFKYNDAGKDWTLDDLKQQQEIFKQFKAVKEGEVWGCNTAKSDFFDVTPFRPDSLLESLIAKDGAFFKKLR